MNPLVETAAGANLNDDSSPSPQMDAAIPTVIPAAIPAAEPVERGRFVLHVHNRDEDSLDGNRSGDDDDGAPDSPASPKSFDSDEIFEDVLQVEEQTSDRDLESLLGPLPSRRSCNTTPSLETDRHGNDDEEDPRRRKQKKFICPCCPNALRRGPCHALAAVMGKDGSAPSTRVGNMIVVFPKCFNSMGFGIVGPHWFGPVCCLFLLTGATSYYIPKALTIGPFSALTCLLFYIVSVVSLFVVSCSDPGVVRAGGLDGGGGRHCYAGVPTANMTAGRGWRFCDLCSVYQPPNAVHCPECNMCIEGYDHHCPWMGTCIGGKNYTPFLIFNLTWLCYLFYAILWVTFVGLRFRRLGFND